MGMLLCSVHSSLLFFVTLSLFFLFVRKTERERERERERESLRETLSKTQAFLFPYSFSSLLLSFLLLSQFRSRDTETMREGESEIEGE
jgi:uncharacterized membrane protein